MMPLWSAVFMVVGIISLFLCHADMSLCTYIQRATAYVRFIKLGSVVQ